MSKKNDFEKIQYTNLHLSRPYVQGIETTNYCVCHCNACPHDKMGRSFGCIDENTFKLNLRRSENDNTVVEFKLIN